MSLSEAFESLENAQQFYHEWTTEVKKSVGPSLIELDVRNGTECWAKLCPALNVKEIPTEPFPKSNDGETFKLQMKSIRQDIWLKIGRRLSYVLLALLALGSVLAIK